MGLSVDEGLERWRQRAWVDENVGQEGEREECHKAGIHHRIGRTQQQPERREDPRETEGKHHYQGQRLNGSDDARIRAVAEDHAEHDGYHACDHIAHAVAKQ